MEILRLVLVALGVTAFWIGAHSLWAYLFFGQYRAARQRLQHVVAEVLGDTDHATSFLFIVGRKAEAVEVRLPVGETELHRFREILAIRLGREFPDVQLSVGPLTENLEHLRGAVAVWGPLHGNVYVGRGGVEHAA